MTRQHTRVTIALTVILFSISTVKSNYFINQAASEKHCQLFLISGKFVLNRNESLIHDRDSIWYDQNDEFYPWYNKNVNENETLTHVKWVTDQTNIKNPACENTLYTPRNTKKCLNPAIQDQNGGNSQGGTEDVINSKSSLILFGSTRTKQLYQLVIVESCDSACFFVEQRHSIDNDDRGADRKEGRVQR